MVMSMKIPESLVLTEYDYLDFLAAISSNKKLLPPRIQKAFTDSSLLFLGYRIADWDFHVLFRILAGYLERSTRESTYRCSSCQGMFLRPKKKKLRNIWITILMSLISTYTGKIAVNLPEN